VWIRQPISRVGGGQVVVKEPEQRRAQGLVRFIALCYPEREIPGEVMEKVSIFQGLLQQMGIEKIFETVTYVGRAPPVQHGGRLERQIRAGVEGQESEQSPLGLVQFAVREIE